MLLPNPRGSGIACRTGDRVRRLPGGNYDFLGRVDHMVKTRGYRVELGEVEAALNSHPAVLDAVAVAVPDERIGNRIAASVVLRSGQSITVDALRTYCSQRLPSYMLPEQLELRDELPRTSTGKADRSCLLSEWKGKSEK
jgi:acyl-coenzyme A synthetase/AMP-(fatty) acid ligase